MTCGGPFPQPPCDSVNEAFLLADLFCRINEVDII